MEKVILATVGNEEITKDQMIGILRNIPEEHAQSVAGEEGRIRLLDEMIAGELLSLDAISQGFDKDEDYLAIVEEARRGLLQRYAVNKLFDSIEVSDDEINEYYEENKSQFIEPEKATAKHILVDSEEKANAIKEEIVAGKEFGVAAMEHSSCPSKERGGELGSFAKGQMVKEFEDAAFAATIGELTGPVKTQFGFHLIVVDEVTIASEQPLEAVVDKIKGDLASAKQQEVYMTRVEELKSVYPVKVNPEGVK
jgi:peptidyl-prolyl cis-trans isomerase C